MRKLRMHRDPLLNATVLAELLVLHFVLCYPGSVARGHPPLEPFWLVSIYVAFLGVGLPPLFDDFVYAPRVGRSLLAAFSVASALLLCIVYANRMSWRPSIHHSAGYLGVIYYDYKDLILCMVCFMPMTLIFVFCCESVARRLWDRVREFSSPRAHGASVRGLLWLVVSVGILSGALRFAVSLDPWYFSRPFWVQ